MVAVRVPMATPSRGFYMDYTAKHILHDGVWKIRGRVLGAVAALAAVSYVGMTVMWSVPMANFFVWAIWAAAVFVVVAIVTLAFGLAAYPIELKAMLKKK